MHLICMIPGIVDVAALDSAECVGLTTTSMDLKTDFYIRYVYQNRM